MNGKGPKSRLVALRIELRTFSEIIHIICEREIITIRPCDFGVTPRFRIQMIDIMQSVQWTPCWFELPVSAKISGDCQRIAVHGAEKDSICLSALKLSRNQTMST